MDIYQGDGIQLGSFLPTIWPRTASVSVGLSLHRSKRWSAKEKWKNQPWEGLGGNIHYSVQGMEGSWSHQGGIALTSSIFQPADGIGEESDTPQEASSLFLMDFFMVPYTDGYGICFPNVSRKTHIKRVILEIITSFYCTEVML